MATTARQCQAITKRGHQCQAPAVTGSEFCWWHCPELASERATARSKGGKGRHKRLLAGDDEPPEPVTSMSTLLALLNRQIGDAYKLEPSLSRVRAITQLAGVLVRVLEFDSLEQRMSRIEEALHVQRKA